MAPAEPPAEPPAEAPEAPPSPAARRAAPADDKTGGEAERLARVQAKLDSLPVRPGCYLFHDGNGKVVYVGKAKSLRARVRSYFQEGSSDARYFIPLLRRIVGDLETVVTGSEKEAAVLENELIKQHQPRFNVKLRDDKDFLCLRIEARAEWPRVEVVRRPKPDAARYFGPYHSATAARRTLHLIGKHWKLRTCTDADLASRTRPCLQHQIKRCPAPCVLEVDPDFYRQQVESVSLFLAGRHDELGDDLRARMKEASASLEFERAAVYRDQLYAVEKVREGQRIVSIRDVDQDVLGLYREGPLVELVLLPVRTGRVSDSLSFSLRGVELPDDEVLAGFLRDYYAGDGAAFIPDEVLLPTLPEGAEGVAEWLSDERARLAAEQGQRRPAATQLLAPRRGPRAQLLALARDNAAHAFREKQRAADDVEARLEEVRERLRLPSLPRRIECCDISHLGGGDAVGSVVAFRDGAPDKKRYKYFHLRGARLRSAEHAAQSGAHEPEADRAAPLVGGDDYAAMFEVLSRRFRRGRDAARADEGEEAEREGWDLPDLFVVDGGRGQLGVALAAARDLGLHELPIVSLAKERESVTGERVVDRVYLPGQKNGVELRPTSASLFFLAFARDEAHRFANVAREKLGTSRRLRSQLDDIPGLGAAKTKLLRGLGSLRAIRAASDEAILAVPGVTARHLAALRKALPAPTAPPNPPTAPPSPLSMKGEGEKEA